MHEYLADNNILEDKWWSSMEAVQGYFDIKLDIVQPMGAIQGTQEHDPEDGLGHFCQSQANNAKESDKLDQGIAELEVHLQNK